MSRFLLLSIVSGFILVGCAGSKNISQVKPTPQQLLQPAIDMINKCSTDTSLNTMAYKIAFDTTHTAIIVYLGQSLTHNQYMWQVPLAQIDKTNLNLFRHDYNMSSITLNSYGGQKVVKYYLDNKLRSSSPQFVLYLGKCFSSNEKDEILDCFKRAIAAAQEDMKSPVTNSKPAEKEEQAPVSNKPQQNKAASPQLN